MTTWILFMVFTFTLRGNTCSLPEGLVLPRRETDRTGLCFGKPPPAALWGGGDSMVFPAELPSYCGKYGLINQRAAGTFTAEVEFAGAGKRGTDRAGRSVT